MAVSQRADLHRRADAILDAVVSLTISAGPRRLRIDEVAARAGVGKGTVYLHWPSREHLLIAAGAREAAAMYGSVVDAIKADPAEAALSRYLRRHFLETAGRPILTSIFVSDRAELEAVANHPARAALAAAKRTAAREHLDALQTQRLLRSGLDLDEVEYAAEAIAYGFFAAAPLLPDDARFTVEHRADGLAEVLHRAFEPVKTPAPERYEAAAPQVIDAFQRLADAFHRTAYGKAAD
jgi:AcrR family transcriptional regulator